MNTNIASRLPHQSKVGAAAAAHVQNRELAADDAAGVRPATLPTETLLSQLEGDIAFLSSSLTDVIQGLATKIASLRERYFELQHQVQQVHQVQTAAHDRATPHTKPAEISAAQQLASAPSPVSSQDDGVGDDEVALGGPADGGNAEVDDPDRDLDEHFAQVGAAQDDGPTLRAAPSGMRRPGMPRQEVTDAVYSQPSSAQSQPAQPPAAATPIQAVGSTAANGGMRRPGQVTGAVRPTPSARASAPPAGLDPMGGAPTRGMRRMGSAG